MPKDVVTGTSTIRMFNHQYLGQPHLQLRQQDRLQILFLQQLNSEASCRSSQVTTSDLDNLVMVSKSKRSTCRTDQPQSFNPHLSSGPCQGIHAWILMVRLSGIEFQKSLQDYPQAWNSRLTLTRGNGGQSLSKNPTLNEQVPKFYSF